MKIEIFSVFRGLCRGLLSVMIAFLAVTAAPARSQGVPVAVNVPETVTGNITLGMTSLEMPFLLSGADGVSLDLIVPVDGATFTLIDPAGTIVLEPGNPGVEYNPGNVLTPPLPGGIFVTPELANPADGTWKIRVNFPAATANTVVLGTVLARSRYQVGIVIERDRLITGEDVSVGIIVLDNGHPVTGLSPTIAIGLGVPGTPLPARDDGQDSDGLSNDGVYSVDYTFGAPGTYELLGDVVIQTAKGPVTRKATSIVQVADPSLTVNNITLTKQFGVNGCVNGLQVTLDVSALKAGTFTTRVQLTGGNGKTLERRKSQALSVGPGNIRLVFSAADIKEKIAVDGPYALGQVESLEVASTGFTLAYRRQGGGSFDVRLSDLCSPPIELQEQLTITPILKQGFIDALRASFPVKVNTAGSYQISFKMIGPAGEDISLVNASRSLAVGNNTVTVNLSSDQFLKIGGPYKAISLLVLGGGSSARLPTLGQTPAYSVWQFYPRIHGDLNNDNAVDQADAVILAQFRGVRAVSPGDRRDISKDGVIDIRDIRELQKLKCSVGTCPLAP